MMMDQMTLPPVTLGFGGGYPTMENSTTSLSLAGMEKFPLASDWVAFWVVLLVTVTDPSGLPSVPVICPVMTWKGFRLSVLSAAGGTMAFTLGLMTSMPSTTLKLNPVSDKALERASRASTSFTERVTVPAFRSRSLL